MFVLSDYVLHSIHRDIHHIKNCGYEPCQCVNSSVKRHWNLQVLFSLDWFVVRVNQKKNRFTDHPHNYISNDSSALNTIPNFSFNYLRHQIRLERTSQTENRYKSRTETRNSIKKGSIIVKRNRSNYECKDRYSPVAYSDMEPIET